MGDSHKRHPQYSQKHLFRPVLGMLGNPYVGEMAGGNLSLGFPEYSSGIAGPIHLQKASPSPIDLPVLKRDFLAHDNERIQGTLLRRKIIIYAPFPKAVRTEHKIPYPCPFQKTFHKRCGVGGRLHSVSPYDPETPKRTRGYINYLPGHLKRP